MFVLLVIINFVIVVIITRTLIAKFMGFLGADWFEFNPIRRAISCLIVSIILALIESSIIS